MGNTVIHEELNAKQQKMFDEWISHIKAIYGEYGNFTWKTELDLTDVDSW